MKGIMGVIAAMLIVTGAASAQGAGADDGGPVAESRLSFVLYPQFAIPVGNMADWHTMGFGGLATARYLVAARFMAMVTTGYLWWGGKSVSFGTGSMKYPSVTGIPLMIGGRYYIVPALFVGGDVGVQRFTVSGQSNTETAISPLVGYQMALFGGVPVELVAQYTKAGDLSYFGFRLGVSFPR